jgi:hypothetical protein
MPRWLVDLVGKRVTRLGTVNASSERDAINEASSRFGIEPVNRSYRVVVTKISERDKHRPVNPDRESAAIADGGQRRALPIG